MHEVSARSQIVSRQSSIVNHWSYIIKDFLLAESPMDTTARDIISDSGALLELSTVLNASTDLDFILGNVLLSSMGKLLVTRSAVFVEHGERSYKLRATKGMHGYDLDTQFDIPIQWEHVQNVAELLEDGNIMVREFARYCAERNLEIVIPMRLEERMVGILALSGKITGKPFESSDLTFLESVAAVAATAVRSAVTIEELRLVNRRLDKKVQEMNTLFELSREMSTTFDLQTILRILSYALMGQLRVLRYVVFTWDGSALRPAVVRMPDFVEREDMHNAMMSLRETIQFSQRRPAENDVERWLQSQGAHCIVPMLSQNELRGVLCLGDRVGGEAFDRGELEYLSALAKMTISEIENARLFGEMVEKQRMEKELSLAKSIQQGLLPKHIPDIPSYDISAINESSQQVGGDYYDIIPLSPHEYVLAIGDVAGKGIPAALLMANVQAALRTIAPLRLPLPEATTRINSLIYANTDIDKFITFFWGLLDTDAHTFQYVNAGHNPPYLLRGDGGIEELCDGGLILGILDPPPPYTSGTVTLLPGDTIIGYTDGVNEAMSGEMVEFGDDRFLALVEGCRDLDAWSTITRVRDEIVAYTRGAPQSDDITMLVAKRVD
jgi:phosphoserine phosphatase RsbU/P